VDGVLQSVSAAAPVQVPLRAPTPLLDEPRQPVGCEPRT
jgi:alpha,alpha-trehalose phosphorylase